MALVKNNIKDEMLGNLSSLKIKEEDTDWLL